VIFCENVEIGNAKPSLGVGESGHFCESVIFDDFYGNPGASIWQGFSGGFCTETVNWRAGSDFFCNSFSGFDGIVVSFISQGLERGF